MKIKFRIIGMIVCLVLLVSSSVISMLMGNPPDALSIIFGVAAGWALRETLVPKEEKTE